VRKKVDGRAYRGKPFHKPGSVQRRITPHPPLEVEPDSMLAMLQAAVRTPPPTRRKKEEIPGQGELFGNAVAGMLEFVERYRRLGRGGSLSRHRELQTDLRDHLLEHAGAGEELAALLPKLFPGNPKEEERFEAALRLLFDSLEILRVELERQRPGSRQRMEGLQTALARQIFTEGAEADLCAAVTATLLDSRVEIMPLLHEANSTRMLAEAAASPLMEELSEEEVMGGLIRSLEGLDLNSPFELFDAFLQLMAVGAANVQTALCNELLVAENPLIRDMAALMLFHPQAEVRQGVAKVLAAQDGACFTPETLRRLIICRNWFPEKIRGDIDRAIANARKARVECAPLTQQTGMTVYITAVDGAGAQSLQIVTPAGKGFVSCSLLLKQGVGVADAFLVPLENKRKLNEYLAMLRNEVDALESSVDHLDLRICQALADGTQQGNVPSHWLVAIAERVGSDKWRAISFDPQQTLAALRSEMEDTGPRFLSAKARTDILAASADWPKMQGFAASWFEDDATLDREIEKALKKGDDPRLAIIDKVLAKRRRIWLERLLLTALWLKAAKKPSIPWPWMVVLADAVMDESVPLGSIPLMETVAEVSFMAWMQRN
jgi:hypothetical protein